MSSKYRICWRSLLTQKDGHGEYIFEKEEAEKGVKILNLEYRNIVHHWVEEE